MTYRQSKRVIATVIATLFAAAPGPARGVGWRGDGSGVFPGASPPLRWSADPPVNIAWSAPVPPGNGSPIVVGSRVFVVAEPTRLLCFDLATGALRWSREPSAVEALPAGEVERARARLQAADAAATRLEALAPRLAEAKRAARRGGVGAEGKRALQALVDEASALKVLVDTASDLRTPPTGDMIGYASATPVSDGRSVFAVFANGLVAAYDLEGRLRWVRRIVATGPRAMRGYAEGSAASPLLVEGRLIVPFGRLQALDPSTGAELWTGGPYLDFGTPAVVRLGDVEHLATAEGRLVRVHDGVASPLHTPPLFYVGPVATPGALFFVGSPGDAGMLEAGGARSSAYVVGPTGASLKWHTLLPPVRTYATPVVYGGFVFSMDADGALLVLDASSGELRHSSPRSVVDGAGMPVQSLTVAGDHVFASYDDGFTRVFEARPPFRKVAGNWLFPGRATPFFAGDAMVVRGQERLVVVRSSD